MRHTTIEGVNAHPGAPNNWDPARDGPCGVLPVRVTWDGDKAKTCESAWVPSPEELRMLIDGGTVRLTVAGWQVPVSLHVDAPLPICILARNRIDADRWYRNHLDEVHSECVYAYAAQALLGRHFSRVVEIKGFEARSDAIPVREVALAQIHSDAPRRIHDSDTVLKDSPSHGEKGGEGLFGTFMNNRSHLSQLGYALPTKFTPATREHLLDLLEAFRNSIIEECAVTAEIALAKTAASDIRRLK